MELLQYLKNNGISQSSFARKINLDRISLNRIVLKKQRPRLITAMKIQNETYGKVTCQELVNLDSDKKGKKKQRRRTKNSDDQPKLGVGQKTVPQLDKNVLHSKTPSR